MEKSITETECTALENLFHQIISNMKTSFPAWEDLMSKALKLNTVLRTTISATGAFLEAFQKVANLALSSRGATSDAGSTLTRLCLRQRAIEDKLKLFAGSIVESLVSPLQEHLEEWKKTVALLDKDHAKESKRAHQDIKKAYTETVRLKKKSKKGKAEVAKQLDHAVIEYNEKYEALEVIEKNAVRAALVEEHNHFCHFILCLKPLMDCEVAMFSEMSHVEQLMAGLQVQASAPFSCPDTSDCLSSPDVRKEMAESMTKLPEESPDGSQGSRKSSLSSASSGCVHSPSRTSMSGSLQNSGGRPSESRDPTTVSIAKSSSAQTVPLQPQTSWSSWQEQTRTVQRLSSTQEVPSGDQPNTERQVSCESSSSAREPAHQYAVPCSISTVEKLDIAGMGAAVVTGDPEVAMTNLRRTSAPADDAKKLTVVPLEGYVNMNQLACLAVQQQEMNLKKEQMAIDDKNKEMRNDDTHYRKITKENVKLNKNIKRHTKAGLDLPPPPPPDTSFGSATLPGAFSAAAGANAVRRAVSNKTSRTAEDALLTGGEFENVADTVLESSCLPSAAASNYRSLPRTQKPPGGSPSPVPQGLKYSASQRFQHGATMIRQGPMRDRSLPPISRKSLKTATLPLNKNSSPAFPVSHASTSLRRAPDYKKQIEQLYESRLEAMPPPPPPETQRPVFTLDDSAFDDLPLPPPPEELRDTAVCPQVLRKAESGDLVSSTRRQGSVVSSHASIIESLNFKFSERQTLPREAIAANFARGRRASDAMCVEDTRSVSSPPSADTLTSSIQRGVQLRRTVTNDRSAPRLPSNHL